MHSCICYIEQSNGPLLENRYQTQVVSIVDASDDAYLGKEGREAAQALAMELIPGTKGHPLTPESDVPCRGGVVWGLPLLTRTPAFGNGQESSQGVPALQLASSATPNERLTSCRHCNSPSQGS
jgi:hypothetical protein